MSYILAARSKLNMARVYPWVGSGHNVQTCTSRVGLGLLLKISVNFNLYVLLTDYFPYACQYKILLALVTWFCIHGLYKTSVLQFWREQLSNEYPS